MRKVLFQFFIISLLFGAGKLYSTEAVLDRFSAPATERRAELTELSEDGCTLKVDATRNNDNWNFFWRSGTLKPLTTYTVTFRYRLLDGHQESGFLHLLCRPLNLTSRFFIDTFRQDLSPEAEERTAEFRFRTGFSDDYAFQIHGGHRVKAEITGLRITEDKDTLTFIPARPDAPSFQAGFGKLPSGAKEFEVELPDNPHGKIVKAADFGFSEFAADNVEALNRAIEHCRKIKAARLELSPGEFRMTIDWPVLMDGLCDFELDGKGASLIYQKKQRSNFRVLNCKRVAIRNLNMDWDWERDPLGSVARVEQKKDGFIDFCFFEYDRFPRRDIRILGVSGYDAKTGSVGIEDGLDIDLGQRGLKWISDNVLRGETDAPLEAGELYRLKHYNYDMNGFEMEDNHHLTFEDINVHGAAGHAFCVQGHQQYWQMNRVRIVPPAGKPRRPITCTADHLHFYRSNGFFKLENSEFSFGGDDCLNVHDTTGFSVKTGKNSLRVKTMNAPAVGSPVELRHGDYSPIGLLATVTAVKPVENTYGTFDVVLDRPIPEPLKGERGFVLFDRSYGSRNILIRNNYFHDNRARGLLILTDDVTIENNRFFHNQMGAIKIETGYTLHSWCEGYGASNIVVRGNRFDTVNPQDVGNDGMSRDIFIGVYLDTDPSSRRTDYPILSNILFENNIFKDTFGLVAFISSAGNVTFRNNTFHNPTRRKMPYPYRGEFYVTDASNVKIVNNRYISSPNVPKPGVMLDSRTTHNIIVEGNTVTNPGRDLSK